MGKEWLYCIGGGRSRSTKRGRSSGGGGGERNTGTTGCMCAVLQLFHLHPFHIPLHKPNAFLPEETTTYKGLEATRNSLELKEPYIGDASLPSNMKKDKETLTIHMGIQIKTRRSRTDDFSPYCGDSPSAKTPLVAKLMGLDLLPYSPSLSLSNHTISNSQLLSLKTQFHSQRSKKSTYLVDRTMITGTSSLPETPRSSSARRSDVDHHHRLSLHINKENIANLSHEIEFPCSTRTKRPYKSFKRRDFKLDEETKSPSPYAKQIVKQVKESVKSKRIGLDITNTIKNRDQRRNDKNVVMIKSKNPSFSPRPKFLEPNKKENFKKEVFKNQNSLTTKPSSHTKFPSKKPIQKCKRDVSERFSSTTSGIKKPLQISDTIRIKKEERFVGSSATKRTNLSDKKCNVVPTLVLVNKGPSPPAAKFPQKQVCDALSSKPNTQIYSCLSHPYNQNGTLQEINHHDRSKGGGAATTTTGKGEEFQYITRILERTSIEKNTLVSFTKWYSPTHPIDPSIFHYLELFYPNSHVTHKCNRKLIFQLVNEILGEILKPNFNSRSRVLSTCGSQLVDALWGQIRNFPLADCRVLEDIDALIDYDFRRSTARQQRSVWFDDEGESILSEIEGFIVDYLVNETAMVVFDVACTYSVARSRESYT